LNSSSALPLFLDSASISLAIIAEERAEEAEVKSLSSYIIHHFSFNKGIDGLL
jgi:hypothetical protein